MKRIFSLILLAEEKRKDLRKPMVQETSGLETISHCTPTFLETEIPLHC